MKANKVLGQHFLISRSIAERIIAISGVTHSDTVIEIGPGTGMLTQLLSAHAHNVIAIEKDMRMVEFLKEKFADTKNLTLIHEDALAPNAYSLVPSASYKIVANIPYYITARFLRLTLEELNHKPTSMTLMVQEEVADRIVATAPQMNLLALSVQVFGKPKKIFRVSRGSFSPPPRVDSAVINISDISTEFFREHRVSQKDFFSLARMAFSQKRKMLRSSIGVAGNYAKMRPQELSPEHFASLLKTNFGRH